MKNWSRVVGQATSSDLDISDLNDISLKIFLIPFLVICLNIKPIGTNFNNIRLHVQTNIRLLLILSSSMNFYT